MQTMRIGVSVSCIDTAPRDYFKRLMVFCAQLGVTTSRCGHISVLVRAQRRLQE